MSYQEPKNADYGVNSCEGCLAKQQVIDRQFEEINRLKQKLRVNQRKSTEGFFGLSTPSSQIPVKANSLADNQAKKGGAQTGHVGVGRQTFSAAAADEVRTAEVSAETYANCECRLNRLSSNERGIYELEREQIRKIYYEIVRKICPNCRRIVSGRVRNALARVALSNELVVEVADQHYVLGRTLGQIAERFEINYATLAESLSNRSVGELKNSQLRRSYTEKRKRLCR